MNDFVRWLGRLAGVAALAFAAVWLIEASPEQDRFDHPVHACRLENQLRIGAMAVGESLASVERRMGTYTPCPPPPRTAWDQPLMLRGMAAGAVGVLLFLVAAIVPRDQA